MTEKTKQEIIKAQESDFVKGLKKVAESKGYKIGYTWVKVNDDGFESLYFEISKIDHNSYTPDIYESTSIHFGKTFDNKPQFEVQTTSYGALNEEKIQKFMTEMCNGAAMQMFLNNLDWSKCPRIKVEE